MGVKLRVARIKRHVLINHFSTLQLSSEQMTTLFSGAESLFPSVSQEIGEGQGKHRLKAESNSVLTFTTEVLLVFDCHLTVFELLT